MHNYYLMRFRSPDAHGKMLRQTTDSIQLMSAVVKPSKYQPLNDYINYLFTRMHARPLRER